MKKIVISSLLISLIPGAVFAMHPRITELMNIKQEKMAKLEKCQGSTKALKIAGLSTLGVTAVGVGVNIAEAVALDNYESKVKTAEKALEKQQKIKDKREEEQGITIVQYQGDQPTEEQHTEEVQKVIDMKVMEEAPSLPSLKDELTLRPTGDVVPEQKAEEKPAETAPKKIKKKGTQGGQNNGQTQTPTKGKSFSEQLELLHACEKKNGTYYPMTEECVVK